MFSVFPQKRKKSKKSNKFPRRHGNITGKAETVENEVSRKINKTSVYAAINLRFSK
jgi:hypothetical protein